MTSSESGFASIATRRSFPCGWSGWVLDYQQLAPCVSIYLSGPVGVYQGLSVSVCGGDRGQGAAGAGGTSPPHTAHHGHHSHLSHATLSQVRERP